MKPAQLLVMFYLDEQRYALYLSAVERVVPALEITRLPKSPEIIAGIINIQGEIIPVANIRKRFNLSEREITASDQFIITRTKDHAIAIIANQVHGVIENSCSPVKTKKLVPGSDFIEGVMKLKDGLVLIHDINKFLSLDEKQELDIALEQKFKMKEPENETHNN